MAKLTKAETKKHNQIMDLVNSDRPLTDDEKDFIIENFHEGSNTNNAELGAFFTPIGLAYDFTIDACSSGSVIDLCAGIGGLSFCMFNRHKPREMVCIELNRTYYELGKRILPEATWIHGDALTTPINQHFDLAISNPPFGKIKTSDWKGKKYTGAEFEYKIMERAMEIADWGCFIIPQSSANFKYSGSRYFEWVQSAKCKKFLDQTGFEMAPGCGIDTGYYLDEWNGVKPMCEVIELYPVSRDAYNYPEPEPEKPEPVSPSDLFTFRIE